MFYVYNNRQEDDISPLLTIGFVIWFSVGVIFCAIIAFH